MDCTGVNSVLKTFQLQKQVVTAATSVNLAYQWRYIYTCCSTSFINPAGAEDVRPRCCLLRLPLPGLVSPREGATARVPQSTPPSMCAPLCPPSLLACMRAVRVHVAVQWRGELVLHGQVRGWGAAR